MALTNHGRIWMQPGETLTISSSKTDLLVGGEETRVKNFTFTAPKTPGVMRIKPIATDFDQLLFYSSTGNSWSELVRPDQPFLIELIIEPQADDVYCSINPDHPVSSGQTECRTCGAPVIHSQG